MYIERKAGEVTGDARIGRVTFSKTFRTMYYDGKEFLKVKGYKYNFEHIATVNEQLLKAGVRLAGILNQIFG